MSKLKEKPITLVSPELKSFKARAGGLGPIVEELAKALANLGCKVNVFSAIYKYYMVSGYKREIDYSDLGLEKLAEFEVEVSGKAHLTKLFKVRKYNLDFFFLANEELTDAMYVGDQLKFSIFLAKGLLSSLLKLNLRPKLIHLNDAQTSLVAAFAKHDPYFSNFFADTKFVFTVHNAGSAYQQVFDKQRVEDLDLPSINWDRLVWNGKLNLLYTGVVNSDLVNTVSKDYAVSLRVNGEGLKEVFCKKRVFGILNGIDVGYWQNPAFRKASARQLEKVKAGRKAKLVAEIARKCGKQLDEEKLIVVMPRRLAGQKGFDKILAIAPKACEELDIQFILLGAAHPNDAEAQELAHKFKELHERLNEFVFIYGFDESLAKLMYAGGDLLLYPSLPNKEPCGTGYMMSMVNATPCLGTRTGGLDDVIKDFDEILERGNGMLVWKEEYSAQAFYDKLKFAAELFYKKRAKWKKLMLNALKTDVSIENTAKEYVLKVYSPLV